MQETVYSPERTRVLGIALRVVQVLAVAMVALGVVVVVGVFADPDLATRQTELLFVLVLWMQGGVLFTVARWARHRLPVRTRDTRAWCIGVAVVTLLSSLPLLSNLLGFVTLFVGLFVLTSALRVDRAQ